jgi:hypothetical protein
VTGTWNAWKGCVQRIALFLLCLAAWLAPLPAAILERLSLDELTRQSTAIVRAKAVGSYAEFHGSMIYTQWKLEVADRWKGPDRSTLEVLIPGGRTRVLHQDVAGAPKLLTGNEYLLFLWTSKSGATYITGLSQGLFELEKSANNEWIVSRPANGEPMLEHSTWTLVKDESIQMRYSDITSHISAILAQGGGR